MTEFYKCVDLSLSRNDLPKSKNNTKSHLGALITLGFLIYSLKYIIETCLNYSKSYKIALYEIFLDTDDKEQIIEFGFKIPYDIIKYEILDQNNIIINETLLGKCDENLKEIKEGDIEGNYYICFINHKFFVSNNTNHLLKIHFFLKNITYIEEEERIKLSIKFREPIINHEEYDPFIYPENINELNYFYDVQYITRYIKLIKIINYKTKKESEKEYESTMFVSKFLEDFDDTSKVKENTTNEFLGSFRLSLSKKKNIFIRSYPDIFSEIGGHLSTILTFVVVAYIIFIRFIDNIRLYNSIPREPYKKDLINLINQEESDDTEEICCCCCSCCDKQEKILEYDKNLNIINNEDEYYTITCENKWHYYFYKISRVCFKKKSNVISNESCCESCCECLTNCICNTLKLIYGSFCGLFCFCDGCGLDLIYMLCCCCCIKKDKNNQDDDYSYCEKCKLCLKIVCEGIFCCCKNNNKKNKILRRIDEYLEEHSESKNYIELLVEQEKSKLKNDQESNSSHDDISMSTFEDGQNKFMNNY